MRADITAMRELNDRAVPAVNALRDAEWEWLVAHAAHFRVLRDAEGMVGFLLCLPAGLDYWSDNYRWFETRYDDFLYLDRVVVAERARGRGVGTALYADLHAAAHGRWPRVTLEVNLLPPNPGSMRFHERQGYVAVGDRYYDDDTKAVRLYERPV